MERTFVYLKERKKKTKKKNRLVFCRSRGSVHFVYWRVWCRQDREHEEGHSISGVCCCFETQVQCGKNLTHGHTFKSVRKLEMLLSLSSFFLYLFLSGGIPMCVQGVSEKKEKNSFFKKEFRIQDGRISVSSMLKHVGDLLYYTRKEICVMFRLCL